MAFIVLFQAVKNVIIGLRFDKVKANFLRSVT